MYKLIRPFLFALPPELAHHLSLPALGVLHNLSLNKWLFGETPQLPGTVMGLKFTNPVGLAAGLDKNGDYIDSLAALGFGFIEVGTVTPRPQLGNPTPRLFRIPTAQALINRMGFNNLGVDYLIEKLKKTKFKGVLGVNIGKNVYTPLEKASEDYLTCLYKVYPYADYVAINISSPNTPGLTQLQQRDELDRLLNRLKKVQSLLATEHMRYVPIVIKISPDLTIQELAIIAERLLGYDVDGVIATNTTLSRVGVENFYPAHETGGLSGAPLSIRATEVIRQLNTLLEGKIPIIASGGIMSVADAQEKFEAGASLVQLYSGLIYQGPWLVRHIVRALKQSGYVSDNTSDN
jgi:dihydroorotate dehydrogenase